MNMIQIKTSLIHARMDVMMLTTAELAARIPAHIQGIFVCDQPKATLFEIHNRLADEPAYTGTSRPTVIGQDCHISPLSAIDPENVVIGDRVTIGENAFRLDRETNFFAGSDTQAPPSYELENGNKVYYYIYTSELHQLKIGENVTIGNGAFYGASELREVTLGTGAVIGNEAFYNACKLESIDLSKVVSI